LGIGDRECQCDVPPAVPDKCWQNSSDLVTARSHHPGSKRKEADDGGTTPEFCTGLYYKTASNEIGLSRMSSTSTWGELRKQLVVSPSCEYKNISLVDDYENVVLFRGCLCNTDWCNGIPFVKGLIEEKRNESNRNATTIKPNAADYRVQFSTGQILLFSLSIAYFCDWKDSVHFL
jgi:hypothetical protein